jgi:hypothetical protein
MTQIKNDKTTVLIALLKVRVSCFEIFLSQEQVLRLSLTRNKHPTIYIFQWPF